MNNFEKMRAKLKENAIEGWKPRMKKNFLSEEVLSQFDSHFLRELHDFWMKKDGLSADTMEELDLLEANRKTIRQMLKSRGDYVGRPHGYVY